MPRVLLLGAAGQLGNELVRVFGGPQLLALDRSGADLSRPESLRDVVRSARPEIILNAAAYTAVDRAESEAALADIVNHQAPGVLAEEAERAGAVLVHYSTDYVFDGSKTGPWTEDDETGPLNVYGATKLAGERSIQERCSRHLILRTSWVYAAHGHNFLRTMLLLGAQRDTLRVVDDQWGAPTGAASLARATQAVTNAVAEGHWSEPAQWAGVYHATCAGRTTWRGFADAIFACEREADPSRHLSRVEAIASEAYPTPARRPKNSVLANDKLWRQFHVRLPEWEQELQGTMTALTGQHA